MCRDLSRNWRQMLDVGDPHDLELPLQSLFSRESADTLTQALKTTLDTGNPISDRPSELLHKSGTASGILYAWRVGSPNEAQPALMLSVTEARDFEEAIHDCVRIQTQHEMILRSAGEGIYGLDAEGRVTFGNAATERILGWNVENIIGTKSHDIHHHSHPDGTPYPAEECPIYLALRDGEVHHVDDEVFWHTNGSPVPVEYTSTPIIQNGHPSGAVVVFRDVSRRKAIEKQREEAYEEIKKLKDELEQERDYLRDEVEVTMNVGRMIGESPALKRTLARVEAVAKTSTSVLVQGETGVGKEMIARAIHANSSRAQKQLIKINCASVPKELFESEFFGHVRGAFTGAYKDRIGRLQLANGGTLFLDEVGEIPVALQGKLLRALQEQQFERVGDDSTMSVDVRVIAATNRDLESEIKAGRFREDLYYRLSVFPIEVPPLRDRRQDIIPLAVHFLDAICNEFGREIPTLTQGQSSDLEKHSWPGNIRELRNVIERAVILTRGTRLRLDLAIAGNEESPASPQNGWPESEEFLTEVEFREKERENLKAVLRAADWRIWGPDGAAEMLGIKPSTLAYRVKAFGITKEE